MRPGPGADNIHRASDDGERVTGATLLCLVEACGQIIDGDFDGYRREAAEPWLRIRAIDGGACDVLSDDDSVIDRVMARFATAVELSSK